ncbi:fungal-specific transcription factor domain-containing protein [Colletotrichum navitas]|uniref:Fungal-specific transcription factor domain-containing protein n=1 Tax=Colletotrichum navitas TaxID=681940 RepID=A0AAD8Q183_9PEZI|nr:fungal-specific transcription factor domain-containing protein [Colletotrichum navitas]KAK1593604.1 fungal-specific transcription factor domain-containing protein [Colletotrichum navitas]
MDTPPAPYGTPVSAGTDPAIMQALSSSAHIPSFESHPSAATGQSSAAAAAAAAAAAVAASTTGAAQSRPCDICRQRKTRCVREEGLDKCVMCSFHRQPCTYLRGPLPRKRRKATDPPEQRPSTNGSASAPAGPPPAPVPLDPQEEITQPSPELLEALSPSLAGSEHAATFNQPSLLDGTLGLHLKTHSEYVGNTNYREPSLLDLHRPHDPAVRSVRRLDESTVFLIHRDRETSSEPQRIADLDAIEKVVHPLGSTLVNLYFRIVHPSFPVLHKKVFLEKYARSYHEFSPPLLAAVYLLALDWSLYDRTLATSSWQPDQAALEALALRTMSDDMKRPKISTLQAGLLIQQRFRNNTWTFIAQLIALAQDLGIHVDCSDWAIPDWEKGLRRRLAWALFMQDKWGALVHGRPSHIRLDEDWDVRPCCVEDFPENAADEEHDPEGSAEVVVGRELFLRQIKLSLILSDVLSTFYTAKATRRGGTLDQIGTVGVAELAKPIVMMLREWYAKLPEALQLQETRLKKLSANGSLHLAYISIDLALHRSLVRNISSSAPPELRVAIRAGARARLASASGIIANLQMEHIQSFWGFAASAQLAGIGSFAGLLWATSDDDAEAMYYADRVEEYLWSLRVRAQAAPFVREALRMLESDVSGLDAVRAAAEVKM